jgi:two-component system sensor histidine kinase RegB
MLAFPSPPSPLLQLPASGRLRHIVRLRWVAISGHLAAIGVAYALGVRLPMAALLLVVGALAVINLGTQVRLGRPDDVPDSQIPLHLVLDLGAFIVLLGTTGGVDNPFALFFLLHVVVAALMLPARQAIGATVLVTLAFLLVSEWGLPLEMTSGQPLPASLQIWGGAVAFVLTAAIITWVIVRIVGDYHHQQKTLDAAAQKAANDAAVLHIGSLAAGAAHELGTPLATMAVVIGELRRAPPTPEVARDAEILSAQMKACRDALAQFAVAAGYARADSGGRQRVDRFFESTADAFRATRQELDLECHCSGSGPAPEIFTEQSLKQAILILLNNAADASPHHVGLDVRWTAENLTVDVSDQGRGFSETDLPKLGRMFFTTKAPGKGTGLGLVLAASSVARLGGTIRWSNRSEGGACARVELPLSRLLLDTTR